MAWGHGLKYRHRTTVMVWKHLTKDDILVWWRFYGHMVICHEERNQSETTVTPTCFVGGGMSGHTPRAGLATFGHHDSELVHGVRLEARDGVAKGGCVCGLSQRKKKKTGNVRSYPVRESSRLVRESVILYCTKTAFLFLMRKLFIMTKPLRRDFITYTTRKSAGFQIRDKANMLNPGRQTLCRVTVCFSYKLILHSKHLRIINNVSTNVHQVISG